MTDLFAPKFYSSIQNNIGPNFGQGLNFVTRDHSFNIVEHLLKLTEY